MEDVFGDAIIRRVLSVPACEGQAEELRAMLAAGDAEDLCWCYWDGLLDKALEKGRSDLALILLDFEGFDGDMDYAAEAVMKAHAFDLLPHLKAPRFCVEPRQCFYMQDMDCLRAFVQHFPMALEKLAEVAYLSWSVEALDFTVDTLTAAGLALPPDFLTSLVNSSVATPALVAHAVNLPGATDHSQALVSLADAPCSCGYYDVCPEVGKVEALLACPATDPTFGDCEALRESWNRYWASAPCCSGTICDLIGDHPAVIAYRAAEAAAAEALVEDVA